MFEKVITIVALFTVIAFAVFGSLANPTSRASFNIENSAVLVTDADADGHGTGVFIGNDEIVTAGHVQPLADANGDVAIKFKGQTVSAHGIIFDAKADIALLKLKAPLNGLQPLAPVCAAPELKVGDSLETVGNPLSFRNVHTWGRVASPTQDLDGQSVFIADLTLAPGNSGGPVVHNNKLAGIAIGVAADMASGMIPVQITYPIAVVVPTSVVCKKLLEAQK